MATPGNLDAYVLRRDLDDGRTEFVMLTLWTSMEALRPFAGDQTERAVFYPEVDRFLVDREVTVSHFEVAWSRRGDSSSPRDRAQPVHQAHQGSAGATATIERPARRDRAPVLVRLGGRQSSLGQTLRGRFDPALR